MYLRVVWWFLLEREMASTSSVGTHIGDSFGVTLHNVKEIEIAQQPISEFSIDGTLVANSDTKLSTQKAVKTYVDGKIGGSVVASVDNRIARYHGTNSIQGSGLTIDDMGTLSGATSISSVAIAVTGPGQLKVDQVTSYTGGVTPVGISGVELLNCSIKLSGAQKVDTIDTDTTLAANADDHLVTQKAVKTYIDNRVTAWSAENVTFSGPWAADQVVSCLFRSIAGSYDIHIPTFNAAATVATHITANLPHSTHECEGTLSIDDNGVSVVGTFHLVGGVLSVYRMNPATGSSMAFLGMGSTGVNAVNLHFI